MYYVKKHGKILGPFSLDNLKSMVATGAISPEHGISTDKINWGEASEIPNLFPKPKKSPEMEPEPINLNSAESPIRVCPPPQISLPPRPGFHGNERSSAEIITSSEDNPLQLTDEGNSPNEPRISVNTKKNTSLGALLIIAIVIFVFANPFGSKRNTSSSSPKVKNSQNYNNSNLEERDGIDSAVQGKMYLWVTSKDKGRTLDSSERGIYFGAIYQNKVVLDTTETFLQVEKVLIINDDDGTPGNLVKFTNGASWIITKKPGQEYVLIRVIPDVKTFNETFRFVLTVE